MSDLRQAAQQALEAMEVATNCLDGYYIPRGKTTLPEIEDAITALKAALAEPEPCQYPDCVDNGPDGKCIRWLLDECSKSEDYKPQRLPLTSDKDRPDQGATYVEGYGYVDTRAVRAIERAHGIGGEE